jgi:hypothetical protein
VVLLQVSSGSPRPGSETVAMSSSGGDWDSPAPFTPSKAITERNWVTPRPRMLIATPETMWSTPKVTVATACSSPPAAPKRVPTSTAGPGAPLVAGPAGTPGPHDHHALEADVHDAGALGPEPAEPAMPIGTGEGQARAGCPAGGEVVRTGDHPDDAQQEDQAGDRDHRQRHSGRRQPTAQARGGRARGNRGNRAGAHAGTSDGVAGCSSASCLLTRRCSAATRSGGPARRRRPRTARSCPA